MKISLGQTPNPKQEKFFLSCARHTAYGGARGGGKSWAMRTKFVLLASRYPGLRLLLLRRTLAELKENHVVPLLRLLKGAAVYHEGDKVFKFPNGSRLKLGYCDAEDDVYQYQGQEYDVIGLEEATHFTETQMQFLTTCNRTTRQDFTPRMYYTCNPDGVGHGWVKRLFIDREYRERERPEDYAFIPASVRDNYVLMKTNPEYLATLESLPEARRRAYLDGDWDALEGQYFEEFRREKHVVAPFEIPRHWRRFRSMDWGYNDPCCVLWHAVDEEGRVYTYRELRVNKTLARDVAKKVAELTGDERISYTVASPDMWQKRGQKDVEGESIADTFAYNGVPLLQADSARVIGWQRMREYMADAPDGDPYWRIFDCCRHLIRTIPEMICDEHNAEDIADGLDDHQCEAARYGLMSRPAKAGSIKKPKPKPKPKPYDPLSLDEPKRGGFFTT
ncbi:MAG: phage terminase large subunit [Bacillota bacterium]